MLAHARLGARAVRRLEEHVNREVEFLLGRFEMPLFELFLSGLEMAVGVRDQREDGIFDRFRRWGLTAPGAATVVRS